MFKVGDRVVFGRSHGEQTVGEVVKVNRKTVKVRQLEARGTYRNYPVGTVWTVPLSLVKLSDGKPSAGTPKVGRGFPKRACLVNVITGKKTYGRLCDNEYEYEAECELLYERLAAGC